jgi:hypothetical protein
MAAATGGVRPGRSRSTSSWPRAAYCSTASPRAARQSGCTGTPSAALADQAIRSRPGGRRGEADRAAEVVAVGHGARPAATAAAGPPLEPPVVRDRSQGLRVGPNRRLAGGEQAELGGVGLAERHQPGPPQLHDQLLVVATGTFCSYTPPEPTPWRVSQEEGPPVPR